MDDGLVIFLSEQDFLSDASRTERTRDCDRRERPQGHGPFSEEIIPQKIASGIEVG